MASILVKSKKDAQAREDSFYTLIKVIGLGGDSIVLSESIFKRLVRRLKDKHALIFNAKKLQTSGIYVHESFLQRTRGLSNGIPKHIMSFDEKYLRRCMELIHLSASRAASCDISLNLGSTRMFLDDVQLPKFRGETTPGLARFVIECPQAPGDGNVVISSPGQWIVGSVTGSKSMINILKSPLFRRYGDLNRSVINTEGAAYSELLNSPGGLSMSSPQKFQKWTALFRHQRSKSELQHKRYFSISSTNSSSDRSSTSSTSSAQDNIFHGMLHCTWNCGIPQFTFSIDNQREIYVAKLLKVDVSGHKTPEYVYLFHSGVSSQKDHGSHNNESVLVGKMKVLTSSFHCPDNSSIKKTECVLFGTAETSEGDVQTASPNLKKSKGLAKKVAKVFRTSQMSKQGLISKFGGMSTVFEDESWDPCQDVCSGHNQIVRANLLDSELPPHLELAAIVVQDHLNNNIHKADAGGWGLKFLKKIRVKQTNVCQESAVSSKSCVQCVDGCSSINIIVPAGFHGGGRTRNGGPSGLIQRWTSGGSCDCGGWDIGCPLTVLNTRSSKDVVVPLSDTQRECKSFHLFRQGAKQSEPTLKMVNIHEGLHSVHFHSALSALQSFSIAVAIIHARGPTLQPENIQRSQ